MRLDQRLGWHDDPSLELEALRAELETMRAEIHPLRNELARLRTILSTPGTEDFMRDVELEAAHQRNRWGAAHDAGKEPADWFWLIGYLAGKALHDVHGKRAHHIIATAAALLNWHRAVMGDSNYMRPGIAGPGPCNETAPCSGAPRSATAPHCALASQQLEGIVVADPMALTVIDEAEQRLSAARDAEFDYEREDRLYRSEHE